jgi:GT2 family glycosyltransferase
MDSVDFSIIIVSFNTREILKNCIDSILGSNISYRFEIIIVDNHSKDGSTDMIKENYPLVKIIENQQNLLFAKANNQGSKLACGRYLLLLNSDTIVLKGEIEKLMCFIENAPKKISCVGPTILNIDRTIQSQGYALPSIFERITMAFKLNKLIPSKIAQAVLPVGIPFITKQAHKVGWLSGCCILIKKDLYDLIGGLNDALGFYGEDVELGWRLKKLGFETWVINASAIVHLGGRSTINDCDDFLNDVEEKLYRYSQLQKYTVGYKKAIYMSKIVMLSEQIKKILSITSEDIKYFERAIEYEKRVVIYLSQCLERSKL